MKTDKDEFIASLAEDVDRLVNCADSKLSNRFPLITPVVNSLIPQPSQAQTQTDKVVLAEIPINSTTLHNIALGKCCTIGQAGEVFAVRFLLQNSFKSRYSNFVINNFMMQVIAVGKSSAMRKEDIAVQTKVVKVAPPAKPPAEKLDKYEKVEEVEMI